MVRNFCSDTQMREEAMRRAIMLSPRGHLVLSEDIFVCHNWGEGAVLISGG